jgi:hypothetical protein
MISQPQCDQALAASVFWNADPLYYLRRAGAGEDANSEGFLLLDKVLRNWRAGFYPRSELSWYENHRNAYADAVAARPDRRDPFSIPKDIFDHSTGERRIPGGHARREQCRAVRSARWPRDKCWVASGQRQMARVQNPKLRRRAERKRERTFQRAGILYIVKNILAFWGCSLLWLAPLSVLIIAGAFLLRWINKGVLF